MTNQKHKELDTHPLTEWFAGQIDSPVMRLRFLRASMLPRQSSGPLYSPRISRTCWFLLPLSVVLFLFTAPALAPRVRAAKSMPGHPAALHAWPATVGLARTREVWEVEKTAAFETYSNGLRIDNRFSVGNRPRSYRVFSATRPDDLQGQHRSDPAGIVFHTTESPQAPFDAEENSTLKRIGESLLNYVRLKRSYNFLIDRFGRVYRVVRESDAANHAGNSVWADSEWLYVNLNESFLGVSFETQTLPGQVEATVNPAQMRSAALLTEMLRQRYHIQAANCVTHAQVSVSVSSRLVGYHLDWASSFPFMALGLPDNYALPLPAVAVFGFGYDESFARKAGARLLGEAQLGEGILRDSAAAAHMQLSAYRESLQERYLRQLAVVRSDAERTDQEE